MFERIKSELLDKNPEACLPRNLSDEWLEYLARSADKMLGNATNDEEADGCDDDTVSNAASLAVVVRLLDAKAKDRTAKIEVPVDDMFEYMQCFRIELALEEIHRKSEIKYEPATIETILTEREVPTWREAEEKFSR